MQPTQTTPRFAELLIDAVNTPGVLSTAYSQFHNYSFGNVLLAWSQCQGREIPLGPIATYNRWKELGRQVKRGEKALVLCMPVTVKKENPDTPDDPEHFTRFVYKNRWFVLAQTDGPDLEPVPVPTWEKARALTALDVTEIPFESVNGNVLGFAKDRTVAINPVNPMPHKTLFHELAHILLGHTTDRQNSDESTPRTVEEMEAECVALLVSDALGLPGADESRAYVQHWHGQGNPIPEKSAHRIVKVADAILKAGREAVTE